MGRQQLAGRLGCLWRELLRERDLYIEHGEKRHTEKPGGYTQHPVTSPSRHQTTKKRVHRTTKLLSEHGLLCASLSTMERKRSKINPALGELTFLTREAENKVCDFSLFATRVGLSLELHAYSIPPFFFPF